MLKINDDGLITWIPFSISQFLTDTAVTADSAAAQTFHFVPCTVAHAGVPVAEIFTEIAAAEAAVVEFEVVVAGIVARVAAVLHLFLQ